MSISQQSEKNQKTGTNISNSKADRLKQIDALYRSQIKQIYFQSKDVVKQKQKESESRRKETISPTSTTNLNKVSSAKNFKDQTSKQEDKYGSKIYRVSQNESRITKLGNNLYSDKKLDDDKIRASVYLQGQSTQKFQGLRKENQAKEMKIRQLSNKCQGLIQKLKGFLSEAQLQKQMDSLKQYSETKMQRLQNLFKIKNQQIFFKMKLQIIGLLQQFQVSKQEINGINQVNSEGALYSFMVRKLKLKLKDFRSKQQQSNFQIQKDKILNQKYQQRIHYLMQTNQLLKLSQTKLKSKIQQLRAQMNQFLQKLKAKQKDIQDRQSQIFRLKKQNQQLQSTNQKLSHTQRNISSQRTDEKRIYQAKQKQMKALLSSYFLQRKKLQSTLQQKEGQIQEILIRQKFLQQQNERINRQYVRWKERYEWLEKQKQNRQKQYEEQKTQLLQEFVQYKNQHNQGVYMTCKSQTDQAIRKVQQYQFAYQKIMLDLQQERKMRILKEQQAQKNLENSQKEWLQKIKRIQKMKEEQMYELAADHQIRQKQIRQQYEKRQQLLAQQMQARMKALLAENDKKATQRVIEVQNENDQLRKQIDSLSKIIQVKQSLINVMNSRKQ